MTVDNLDLKDVSFYVMFVILYFIVPWIVIEATYSKTMRLDLRELWTYKERLDKFATILMIGFYIHSASMVLWTFAQKVTTADYLAYAGVWVTPILVKMVGAAFGNGHTPPTTKEPTA